MIHVFKARDGRWNIAPESVSLWPQFREQGVYLCREEAEARARFLHPGEPIRVESGFRLW